MRQTLATLMSCVVLLCVGQAAAQSTNASLSGNVVDASGGALPSVTVTLEDIQTGLVLTGTSNDAGIYQFPSVQPGLYRLEAEFPGFQRIIYNLLVVEVGAQVRLNLTLRIAGARENLQVITLDSPLKMNTASVGSVITGRNVRDLPLQSRSVLDLTESQAGLIGGNFSGARIGMLNITRDGVNVMDQFVNSSVNSVIYTSTDLVSEFRVITSPVDAEFGRGSGQVQIETRSGINEFHGSVFETHNDTTLNANTWFNNQRGDPRDSLIWNQFGGRLGGPVIKNKTFFHFLYEAQRRVERGGITSATYTAQARRGEFRFFPGVVNANAAAPVPTVDLIGNPIKPPGATGDLQSINVFGFDPARPGIDPGGTVTMLLGQMPLPNSFRSGDGLNTAGYSWSRTATSDNDQYNVRFDHQLSERHRLNLSWARQSGSQSNRFIPQLFPQSPLDKTSVGASFFSVTITSSPSSRFLNQFHAGAQRARYRFFSPWELEGRTSLPKANGIAYQVNIAPLNPGDNIVGPQGRISPLYVWEDKLAWKTGRHAFKVGGEIRFGSANSVTSNDGVTPAAIIGSSGALSGLTPENAAALGQNLGAATNLLNVLSGSVAFVQQAFNASAGANPVFLAGEPKQRTWRQREFSVFFKDDWSLRPNLVLNAGIRYEYYSVPWEANGKAAGLVGGSSGLFGLSGTSFADFYQPGRLNGSLTRVELIGKNSVNPTKQLYNDDWNNFAPAIGLNWSLPYFGKDKTVLRVGYSIGYEKNALRLVDVVAGDQPGLRAVVRSSQYPSLSRIQLPLTPITRPLETVPVGDRSQTVWSFDSNLRTPYVQNWNFSIERELPGSLTLDVRYVGSKGTKLIRATNINEANVFESGILNAFLVTQSGGDSPLLDRIFNGLNLGLGVVNGTTVTGSESVRSNAGTRFFFTSNSAGGFANYLNTTSSFTGVAGGLLRRAGLPENLVVGNPQFATAALVGNFANSTFHAMEIDVKKRFSGGWNFQGNYTWSKTLGEEDGSSQTMLDNYRDGRNRRLDKRLLTYHVEHVFRNTGTFELPFGPNKRFGNNTTGLVSRLIESWEFGAIINIFSGRPFGLASSITSFNQQTDNTPDLVGVLPKTAGQVTRLARGVVYFPDLHQVPDPGIGAITSLQSLRAGSTMRAIADAGGNIILVNPKPGKLGNMNQRYLEGPGAIRFDVDLIKRIRFGERTELEFRAVALGLLNSPNFGNPIVDINNPNFGNITGAGGSRLIELHARINF